MLPRISRGGPRPVWVDCCSALSVWLPTRGRARCHPEAAHLVARPPLSEPAGREDPEPEPESQLCEEVRGPDDRLNILLRHIDQLQLSVEDPILACRERRTVLKEAEWVRAMLTHAYGGR